MQSEKKIVELNISDVLPNRFQPRIKFDENSINELALSIKKYGVIQPIVVRKIGEKYEIIAGERRYKASVLAGKQTIPAIISEMTDKDSVEIALIENVQREDLTPIEKAISYKKILDMGYISQEDLAQKVGKSQSSIANTLRLLNLSDDVQEALLENKISERHARSLLKIKDEKKQVEMLNRIINERLTVRKTDEEIDKMFNENNNQDNQNLGLEEVVQIPDVPLTNVDMSVLPGFMDIDNIEQNAQDIIKPEKPVADMDELLKTSNSDVPASTPQYPNSSLNEGKFINFFEEQPETNSTESNFSLENFFSNMNQNNQKENIQTQSSVEAQPTNPAMPSFETPVEQQPMEPVIPSFETPVEQQPMNPAMPSFETPVEQQPMNLAMPSFETPVEAQPMNPAMPSFETPVEVQPMEPAMPSFETPVEQQPMNPAMPSFETPVKAQPMEPVIPSFETPVEQQPMEPVMPSFETPVEQQPTNPVMPSFETPVEVQPMEPAMPSFETPVEQPPMEPVMPSFETPVEAQPMEPVIPSFETPVEQQPMEPVIPSFETPVEAQPMNPAMPSFETPVEAQPMEPVMPSFETPVEVQPMEPAMPSFETPVEQPPMEPVMPSFETPVEAQPTNPVMPSSETPVEQSPMEPVMPSFETPVEAQPPMEPAMPSFETPVASDNNPIYEVPIVETNNIPIIKEANIVSNIEPQIQQQTSYFESPSLPKFDDNNNLNKNTGTTITAVAPNIKLALNTIRECENTLEKYGFNIDVEEIDFEDSYQVIFKIEKK